MVHQFSATFAAAAVCFIRRICKSRLLAWPGISVYSSFLCFGKSCTLRVHISFCEGSLQSVPAACTGAATYTAGIFHSSAKCDRWEYTDKQITPTANPFNQENHETVIQYQPVFAFVTYLIPLDPASVNWFTGFSKDIWIKKPAEKVLYFSCLPSKKRPTHSH